MKDVCVVCVVNDCYYNSNRDCGYCEKHHNERCGCP